MPKSSIKNPQRAIATTRRPQPRRSRTPAPGSRGVSIRRAPTTVSSVIQPYFNQTVGGDITTIRGRDLIIPDLILRDQSNIAARIPMCPRLWAGTRISILASTFSSHRPKRVKIHFQSGVGTATAGSLVYGTFPVDMAIPSVGSSLTQNLVSSSGGSTPIWCPVSFNVPLVGLQRPWYEVEGITEDSIPLITYFSATNYTNNSNAGALWIEYEWEFCRPLVGSSTLSSGLRTVYDLVPRNVATTATSDEVTFAADPLFPIGQSMMVSPCNKIANYIYANAAAPQIGDWSNAGVDFLAEVISAVKLRLLDDNGDALFNSVTTGSNWAFFARAVLGTLL